MTNKNNQPNSKQRVLSGMRTTGRMHLGNYHGALKNWLQLQDEYECFFFAADWHALTTHYADLNTTPVKQLTTQMITDWLAAGLDPERCTIFVQSAIKEHAELHLLLSMITPISWLERVPSYKDQQLQLKDKNLDNYGFLGYPVLQSADVLAYKADFVPVGADQMAHIELIREIARKFNHLYGKTKIVLPDPQVLLSDLPKFPGLDGRKMSKSYNNTIQLTEEPKSIETKIKIMPTDPARVRRVDPGTPEKCPVWQLHLVYSSEDTKKWVQQGCTSAGIGCLDCKAALWNKILVAQQPILARYQELNNNPQIVMRVIQDGNEKARAVARETLREVRDMMGLTN